MASKDTKMGKQGSVGKRKHTQHDQFLRHLKHFFGGLKVAQELQCVNGGIQHWTINHLRCKETEGPITIFMASSDSVKGLLK
jgi:hypothetical protein